MTVLDLDELRYLDIEAARLEQELHDIARWKRNLGPAARIDAQAGEMLAALESLEHQYRRQQKLCAERRDHLQKFIDGIPDPFLHDLFRLRFDSGLRWFEVAAGLRGYGHYTAEGVKKQVQRYLNRVDKMGNRAYNEDTKGTLPTSG